MSHPIRILENDLCEIESRAREDLAFFDGKRVLVTGGAGFLLSHFVELLARRPAPHEGSGASATEVVVADAFTTGLPERLAHLASHPRVRIENIDVAVARSWDEPFDVIVHGASIASPIIYRRHPLETIEANVLGTLNLLRAFADRPLAAFVVLSSSEIYGDPDPAFIPTPETYPGRVSCTGPRACYDESKRLAETLATTFHRTHRTPVRIVRPFNVYGPGMRLDDGRAVPSLARAALLGEDLVLHSDGTPTRTFCYVTDFIVGFLRVITAGADGEAYNVGDDRFEISMKTLAEHIRDATSAAGTVRVAASDDRDYLTDNPQRRRPELEKLRALGPADASVSLETGLARYVAWARETDALAKALARERGAA